MSQDSGGEVLPDVWCVMILNVKGEQVSGSEEHWFYRGWRKEGMSTESCYLSQSIHGR